MSEQRSYINSLVKESIGLVIKLRPSWFAGNDRLLTGRVEKVVDGMLSIRHKNGLLTTIKLEDIVYFAPVFHQPEKVV